MQNGCPAESEEDPKPLARLVRSARHRDREAAVRSGKIVNAEVEVKSTTHIRVGPQVRQMIVDAAELHTEILLAREHDEFRIS